MSARTPTHTPTRTSAYTSEQRFYFEQFRGQLLVLGSPAKPTDSHYEPVTALIDELVANGALVAHVHRGPRGERWSGDGIVDREVVQVWDGLDNDGRIEVAAGDATDLVGGSKLDHALVAATQTAIRLRANKLVLLLPSRLSDEQTTVIQPTESYIALDPHTRYGGVVALAAEALAAGVASVNVVSIDDVAAELLTYRGAGTLYTGANYITVERVGYGDFEEVRRLIEAGVADGFLKPRSDAAIRQLVVNGFGARVEGKQIAGFAALLTEPYAAEGAAEVAALSTISRFGGGGVGTTLVNHLVGEARHRGLRSVFATTTSVAAAEFFRRVGFGVVNADDIPDIKWEGYDPQRKSKATSLRYQL